jgi:hypothetical protein
MGRLGDCRQLPPTHPLGSQPAPIAVWREHEDKLNLRLPVDRLQFWVSFLPEDERNLRRDGIHFCNIRYWSDALAADVGQSREKLLIKYDPAGSFTHLRSPAIGKLCRSALSPLLDEVHNISLPAHTESSASFSTRCATSATNCKFPLVCFGVREAREAISGDVQLEAL